MEKNEHEHIVINFNLINDYDRLSRDEFYSEYRHRFPYIYRTEHPQWEDFNGIKYQYCVDGYLELDYIPRPIEDGHHRRRVLYHRGWLRRCIKPDITPDALFYNLAIDVKRFISEKRNIITKESRMSSPIQIGIIANALRPNVPNRPILSVNQLQNKRKMSKNTHNYL